MEELKNIKKQLEKELSEVREVVKTKKPPNEACTRNWIISPLLEAAGYSKPEIIPEDTTVAGTPDYTILPDTDWTWYLEAKSWDESNESLKSEKYVTKLLNYVNTKGKRWGVLSNGRYWLLYDNHRHVEACERLVSEASLDDTAGFLEFMMAISKPSVTSGKLEEYALKSSIKLVLDRELANPESRIIQQITDTLKATSGIKDVTPEAVVNYFKPASAPAPVPPPIGNNIYTLSQLLESGRKRVTSYTKPVEVIFPDNSVRSVRRWRDAALSIISWFAERDRLPDAPVPRGVGKSTVFLSTEPKNLKGKEMFKSHQITVGSRTWYVNIWSSPYDYVSGLCALCEFVNESPDGFRIKLAEPLPEFDLAPHVGNNIYTLSQLRTMSRKNVIGRYPIEVIFPDNSSIQVKSWKDLAVKVVKWFGAKGVYPEAPLPRSEGSKRLFLAREPKHATGTRMSEPFEITIGSQVWYMEGHNSSYEFVKSLCSLCNAVNESPDGFRIKLAEPILNA